MPFMAGSAKEGSRSFLKKGTKKLLRVAVRGVVHAASANRKKFFVSFFQKRNTSFSRPDAPIQLQRPQHKIPVRPRRIPVPRAAAGGADRHRRSA
jgi:hypothetical protein